MLSWLENAYSRHFRWRTILICKVGQADLALVCDQGSLVDTVYVCARLQVCVFSSYDYVSSGMSNPTHSLTV